MITDGICQEFPVGESDKSVERDSLRAIELRRKCVIGAGWATKCYSYWCDASAFNEAVTWQSRGSANTGCLKLRCNVPWSFLPNYRGTSTRVGLTASTDPHKPSRNVGHMFGKRRPECFIDSCTT